MHKRYEGDAVSVHALKGVDLSVDPGELVALMGPSGCGKSTLLHLLGALDTPTEGEVVIDGQRLRDLTDRERTMLRRHRIGFVFQFFNLVPVLTAAENIALPAVIDGMASSTREERVRLLLDLVGLGGRADHVPSRLSGGEQQRVALARALVHEPPLLLADEPTGNLDSKTAAEILELLKTLAGKTILIVTHDRTLAESFARRTVELRDGKVVADDRR